MTTTDPRGYSRLRASIDRAMPKDVGHIASAILAPADLAVLIGRAMLSPDVPSRTKAYLIFAGLYTSAGLDIVPDALLGPIGVTDDGIVILEALHRLLNCTEPAVLDTLWPGDVRVLRTIQGWVFEARESVHHYVIRPIARWLRRTIGQAIAGTGGAA